MNLFMYLSVLFVLFILINVEVVPLKGRPVLHLEFTVLTPTHFRQHLFRFPSLRLFLK